MSKEYRDPDTLRKLYWGERLSLDEVSDRLGCSEVTVLRWMERHEIPRRDAERNTADEDYRDPEILRELYHSEGLSLREIASRLGCNQRTVGTWMERHRIETRSQKDAASIQHASYRCTPKGYEEWSGSEGERLRVHRLLAISDGVSPHAVFGEEAHIHHKNGVKWDNRPENIEVLSNSDHIKHHANSRTDVVDPDNTYRSKDWLRGQYIDESKSARRIAKELGSSPSTIRYWIDRHDIPKRPMSDLVSHGKKQPIRGEH